MMNGELIKVTRYLAPGIRVQTDFVDDSGCQPIQPLTEIYTVLLFSLKRR